MLLAYVNATALALTVGDRSNRVGAGAAAVLASQTDAQSDTAIENCKMRYIGLPPLRILQAGAGL